MDDKSIVSLFWERDERAITVTVERYGNYCKGISLSILHSEADAEECVNDTWLRAWETIPPKRPNILGAYLAKIVRNLSIDKLRSKNAEKRSERYTVALSEIEGCLPGNSSTEKELEDAALAELIGRFLRSVSKNKRVLFIGRYWNLLSIEELARQFELSEANVKTTLHRTRCELREFLTKEGYDI